MKLKVAVMAGEDQRFRSIGAFDVRRDPGGDPAQRARRFDSRRQYIESAGVEESVPVGWPQLFAKGLEAWFTGLIEVVVQATDSLRCTSIAWRWDEGVFGAEAAALGITSA